jgi:hypothetical protein
MLMADVLAWKHSAKPSNDEAFEQIRVELNDEINKKPKTRQQLEADGEKVYDASELQAEFTVHGFLAPYVFATRKSDGKKGTLMFQHGPRFYFGFEEEEP